MEYRASPPESFEPREISGGGGSFFWVEGIAQVLFGKGKKEPIEKRAVEITEEDRGVVGLEGGQSRFVCDVRVVAGWTPRFEAGK